LLAVAVALLTSLGADVPRAHRPSPRVGVLASSNEANFEPRIKVLRAELHVAGWVEGRNLTVVRYPGEQCAQLREVATERSGSRSTCSQACSG
jgi:hypothetical protein